MVELKNSRVPHPNVALFATLGGGFCLFKHCRRDRGYPLVSADLQCSRIVSRRRVGSMLQAVGPRGLVQVRCDSCRNVNSFRRALIALLLFVSTSFSSSAQES